MRGDAGLGDDLGDRGTAVAQVRGVGELVEVDYGGPGRCADLSRSRPARAPAARSRL